MRFVIRMVEHRRPCSSLTAISCTVIERPRWIGVHTPVTYPDVAERVWVALMSIPTASLPGPAQRFADMEPRDSPSTTYAPPCRSMAGCVFPSTGIVATARSTENSTNSIPIFAASAPPPRLRT